MATKTKQPDIIEPADIFVGEPNAKVILTVYVDYESEACATFNNILNQLLNDYEGSIRLNIRHFPLTKIHQHAFKAAEAAVAAGQEGKFWPMNNILFANRRQLGTISLKNYSKEIGVTNKRFLDQLINSTFSWHIRGDQLEALDKGIKDVPALFINKTQVKEQLTYTNISKLIDEVIAS